MIQFRSLVILSLPLTFASLPMSLQPRTVRVDGTATTCNCNVVLRIGPRIGSPQDTVQPTRITSIVRRRSGELIVAPVSAPGVLAVYDSTGKFNRLVGRRGAGPGEFGRIRHMTADASDNLHVFDEINRRVAVLDQRLTPVKSTPAQIFPAASVVTLSDGNYAIGPLALPAPRDMAFSIVTAGNGAIVKVPTIKTGENTTWAHRILAPSADGGIWVARRNSYEIDRFDKDGRLLLTLQRTVPWFKPWNTSPQRPDQHPNPSDIIAVWENSRDNQLWIATRTAAADHRPTTDSTWGLPKSAAKYLDLVVEVIDIRTHRLVASTRFEKRYFVGLHGTGMVYEPDIDENGSVSVRPVWPTLGGT